MKRGLVDAVDACECGNKCAWDKACVCKEGVVMVRMSNETRLVPGALSLKGRELQLHERAVKAAAKGS